MKITLLKTDRTTHGTHLAAPRFHGQEWAGAALMEY